MKRKAFMASIFGALGVARTQTAIPSTPPTGGVVAWHPKEDPSKVCFLNSEGRVRCESFQQPAILGWQYGPALGNQCPVCGTMARPVNLDDVNTAYSRTGGWAPTRCKRCNAAFYQDPQ